MRLRLLIPLAVAGVLAAGLALVARGSDGDGGEATATIGVNAVPMPEDGATYRITLDGEAAVVVAPTGVPATLTAAAGFRGSNGAQAFTDRRDGLTRLVVRDPATGTQRVVASHLCGDAFVDPWSPDGRSLAVAVSPPHGGCNGHGGPEVAVVDAVAGHMRRMSELHTTPVTWNRDGSRLLIAVGGRDPSGSSRLVDPRTGKGEPVLRQVGSLFPRGAWSQGRRFYAALTIHEAERSQAVVIVDGSLRYIRQTVLFGQQYAWAPRRQWLAVSEVRRIRVIDAVTGRTVATIPAHTPYGLAVESLRWDRSGRSLLAVAAPLLGHD
jgi:hypothetical protein